MQNILVPQSGKVGKLIHWSCLSFHTEVQPLYLLPQATVQTSDKGKFPLMDFETIFPVEYRTLSTIIYGKV